MARWLLCGKPSEEEILEIGTEFDSYYTKAMEHGEDLINYESKKGKKVK